jgi:hypothetical protein
VAKDKTPFVIFLAFAICAVISALIGIAAACCNNRCCRVTYAIIVVAVVLLEISAIVIALKFKEKLLEAVKEGWTNPDKQVIKVRKGLERQFQCCGFDYFGFLEPEGCGLEPLQWITAPPCKNAIEQVIKANLLSLGIAAIVVTVLETLLLACAICLACEKREVDSDIGRY